MSAQIEINIPSELTNEIESYAKHESQTIIEFMMWALGEKVGELRERKSVKNLTNIQFSPDRRVVKAEPLAKPITVEEPKKLRKADDVAKQLRISKSLAYRLMQQREIPMVQIGRGVRVRQEDLEEYVQRSHQTSW
jgi:excisionase family DNA binding protein